MTKFTLNDGDVIEADHQSYQSDDDGIDHAVGAARKFRGVVHVQILALPGGKTHRLVSVNNPFDPRAIAGYPYIALSEYVTDGCSNTLSNIRVVK